MHKPNPTFNYQDPTKNNFDLIRLLHHVKDTIFMVHILMSMRKTD
jgi:hypothetical protein